MRVKKNTLPKKTGAAMVELAVVLPLLIFLVIGAFDLINSYIAAKKVDLAVFRAARSASIPGSTAADIRKAALDEFTLLRASGVDQYLTLDVTQSATSADIDAQIRIDKAAYLKPIVLKLGDIQRSYSRPTEFAVDPLAIAELDGKPEPTTKGFNKRGSKDDDDDDCEDGDDGDDGKGKKGGKD
ncbi:MAG: TadE family protein [Pirellula sp.]